jgi:hypothetical protein
MPWNPMRVEQRIGRIDRIGQRYETVRIHNFYYDGTVEAKVYRKLRDRINAFAKEYQITFYPNVFDEIPSLRLMNFGEPLLAELLRLVQNL